MATKKGAAARRTAPAKPANAYTIIAPNATFETQANRHFYDGKLRFIEGKARITDALARTCTYKDGVSTEVVPFDSAAQMARHFLDSMSGTPGREWRCVPELPDLVSEAAKVSPYFTRTPEGDGIRVEPKPDAPESVLNSLAAPDEYNPNLGRARGDRIRRQRNAPLVAANTAQQQRSRDASRQKETVAT